jgi:diaminopimelate decarboxylase
MDELDRIDAVCRRQGREADIGIRLKLDLDPLAERTGVSMHGPGTLKEQSDSTKWGMTRSQTVEIVRQAMAMPHIHLRETHFHLSRMSNVAMDFAAMAREMITWSGYIRDHTGWIPPCIDIGGGWTFGRAGGTGPERADDDKSAATFEDYGTEVCEAIKDECQKRNFPLPKLKMEPGRSISGSAGVAIGCVGAVKKHPAKTWINCDLSSNIITWVNFCHWYFPMYPVKDALAKATQIADLVGPLCSSDELGHARDFPELERGDYIALLDCGGYTESTMASFNAQLWPATVLVNGTQADVITERMRLSDVMGRFKVPPRLLDGSYGRLRESG